MRIVLDRAGHEREVELVLDDPHATVADLLAAAGHDRDAGDGTMGVKVEGVEVEGRWFPADHGLDELNLHEGALVRIGPGPPAVPPRRAGPLLAVVEGPAAGATHHLDQRAVTLGRGAACDVRLDDLTVSEWHAEIAPGPGGGWVVRDLASQNGTWVDDTPVVGQTALAPGATIRTGATHLRLVGEVPDDRPLGVDPLHRAVGGVVAFNRPPRPVLPEPPAPVTLPAPAPETPAARALSVASVIAPIVLAGVLVWWTGNARFALFLLLSPVMAVGGWLSGRRQARQDRRASSRAFRAALADLDRDLDAAGRSERARRRRLLPDLAEVARRIDTPSTSLWQRRPEHADHLRLRAGVGRVPWDPPVEEPREGVAEQVAAAVQRAASLTGCPVEVDLSRGGIVGLVGDRSAAITLARSLVVQAATHHGPADLGVAVVTDEVRHRDWEWAAWLPHVRDPAGAGRLLARGADQAGALLGDLLEAGGGRGERRPVPTEPTPRVRTLLLVVDGAGLTQGRRSPVRLALRGEAGPVAGIVLTDTEDQLPAVTTTVVHLCSPLGDARLRRPADGVEVEDMVIGGFDDATARGLARKLARYEDPELEVPGASLPSRVRLLPVLGLDGVDAEALRAAWKAGARDPRPTAPLGIGEDGVIEVDLVADGPHALVGGTTGSGKSELLRSLVAGMAARLDPDHLTFVLIDYKGGSAFDRCAQLPHTVGLVTDLDGHLGERALRSLEAELRRRERLLRTARAQDLTAYLDAGAPLGPLPRLVVVIDEFATLAAELPDLLEALVGVAQRGRSLGVHLILATQRPSGAVDANIKANTNLRIALRMHDAGDSTDVIDGPDAARIPRSLPGRAHVRFGPGDVLPVQTPLSTAVADGRRAAPVRLVPISFGVREPASDAAGGGDGPSDLDRLVEAAAEAYARSGAVPPRRPWLPPLPERVALGDLLGDVDDEVVVPLGLGDDPDRQCQRPVGWDPAAGHLGLFGTVGSGTTTALRTVATALAWRFPPAGCHVHALDLGAGGLAALGGLPNVGTVVPATDRELRGRLLRTLRQELDRRRDLGPQRLAGEPLWVLLVDGVASLLAELETEGDAQDVEAFERIVADGPGVRLVCAMTAERIGQLSLRHGAMVARRLLMRHADPHEFAVAGLRATQLPDFRPGTAVDAESGLVVQLALPEGAAAGAGRAGPGEVAGVVAGAGGVGSGEVTGVAAEPRVPLVLRRLPTEVDLGSLPAGERRDGALWLPVGLAEDDLEPAALELHPGDHALVAGPPRSGTSTTLAILAHQARAADPDTVVLGICRPRSPLYGLEPLDGAGSLEDLADVLRAAATDHRRWVLLVDDAAMVEDRDGLLAELLVAGRDEVHVIAGGRADALRAGFAHWTREVRRSRAGVLLRPDLLADGELLGAGLPRRVAVSLAAAGRGFVVVDGQARLAQVAIDAPPRAA